MRCKTNSYSAFFGLLLQHYCNKFRIFMQNPDSQAINKRFFEAIDELVKKKRLRGKKSFATKYGLNWGNLYQLRKHPGKDFNSVF